MPVFAGCTTQKCFRPVLEPCWRGQWRSRANMIRDRAGYIETCLCRGKSSVPSAKYCASLTMAIGKGGAFVCANFHCR